MIKDRGLRGRALQCSPHIPLDDAVSLSTMKASKFYGSFKPRIDKWEFALALVSEVIETILTVQRKWIYLESIFMASEDICKQLPKESALFVEVNTTFTSIMSSAAKRPNAIVQCTASGMLESVNGMDEKLEAIQKSLDSCVRIVPLRGCVYFRTQKIVYLDELV